jgi:hypothetical protein
MRRYYLLGSLLLLLITILIASWRENNHPTPIPLIPTLTGQVEYCLTCHDDLATISSSHPFDTFGCVICHGGERLALDADLAHQSMRGGRNPSDFSVVQASCGGDNCHSGTAESFSNHIQRATTSIQATYAGAIADIRYTYGVQPDLTARLGIYAVQAPQSSSGITELEAFFPEQEANPYVRAFGMNCLDCHLSALPLPGYEYDHFSGCAACHTPTQSPDQSDLAQPPSNSIHELTTAISFTQCDACHNRGNYDLRTMTFIPRQDSPTDRLHDYYQPIAQFTLCEWELDCVDCHTRTEAMGDGNLYSNEKDIQYIRCKSCHGTLTELPTTRMLTDPNDLAFRLALLNPVIELKLGDTILATKKNEALWNIRPLPDGTYEMFAKENGQRYIFHPVKGSGCQQDPANQNSAACHECHSVER